MLKKITTIWATLAFMISTAFADDFSATLSQNEIPLGETVELTLTYNGDNANNVHPNFNALQTDFQIYSTSNSVRSSYVNGVGSMQRQWKIGLMPKKTGELTIPAIKAGQYSSQPLNLRVLPSGSAVQRKSSVSNATSQPVNNQASVNAELIVNNNDPYVQQELNAVLVINDNRGIEFTSEPQFLTNADDWIVKSLRQPTVEANNQGGRLIKFYYALFPQKSGKQQIPPMQIDGVYTSFEEQKVPATSGFGNLFKMFEMDMSGMFGVKKPIKLLTNPVDIEVKPMAADYDGKWWLPATVVGVAARWVDEKPVFKVGETVAREIAFAAAGVADTQLPDIELPQSKNIKQYPEKPQIDAIADNNIITSQIKMRIVYIPQAGGEQTIPEIRIPWFNVITGKTETAIIPAETVMVDGKAVSENKSAASSDDKKSVSDTSVDKAQTNNQPLKTLYGMWVAIILAFVAGIVLSYLLLRKSLKQVQDAKSADLSIIEQSIKQSDYRSLRDNLLLYGRQIFTGYDINNLNDLAHCVDDDKFSEQMQKLNSILYANQEAELDAKIVINALKHRKKSSKSESKPLPDLYK